jgi:hypothetical protein
MLGSGLKMANKGIVHASAPPLAPHSEIPDSPLVKYNPATQVGELTKELKALRGQCKKYRKAILALIKYCGAGNKETTMEKFLNLADLFKDKIYTEEVHYACEKIFFSVLNGADYR